MLKHSCSKCKCEIVSVCGGLYTCTACGYSSRFGVDFSFYHVGSIHVIEGESIGETPFDKREGGCGAMSWYGPPPGVNIEQR